MSELALAKRLTDQTNAVCIGLEDGVADLLDMVTPTTASLLKFWFQHDFCDVRGFNFHPGQKQAILNTIYAHEVLAAPNLKALYQAVAPDNLLTAGRLLEVSNTKHDHPKYCLKMATGTGKTWVLQALMVWQLLNKNAAPEDARFTRYFLIVAPGLIVYDRLLDAFCGKLESGMRNFASSDVAQYADLFIPENYKEAVFGFIRNNVCYKENIGLKATGGGMVGITNWHLLAEAEEIELEDDLLTALGAEVDPVAVVNTILPVMPGKATGNSLEVLDRRYARGGVLDYLAGLPELMVFNDEAHHIHEIKREGESTEVEWQKSLLRIAESKANKFVQMDFSATPYNDVGAGKNKRKLYFPHIIVDFDLKTAMRNGLVKSLVLDKRKEIGALPLEFKAEKDAEGNVILSEGQRVMLRAGLRKLKKLEADFASIDATRHPKMLVVCEDTSVSPEVVKFLLDEGLSYDEVMAIDSGKKAELKPDEWTKVRERLFAVDKHAMPRVIVSVLMLREGFDVNNICVIVPLRASGAQILLEQTIGRGLRLMWRESEFADLKRENRERINNGQEPGSLIDILSIIEHPAFQSFYNDLIKDGLVGTTGDETENTNSAGDLTTVELVKNYAEFDFAIPFILQEQDESFGHQGLEISDLSAFTELPMATLKAMLGKGDVFISQDLQASTLFGDYRVDGAVMNVSGYNDFIGRLTRRIGQTLNQPIIKGNRISNHSQNPYLQANTVQLAGWLDTYIRQTLFSQRFDPMQDENWRMLVLDPVMKHIVKIFSLAMIEAEQTELIGKAEVKHRRLSEVAKLTVRESSSLLVTKCIYPRLPYPAKNGGLEQAFIQWAQIDGGIAAFCKINENRHDFVHLRYIKDDGLSAFYSPDFLVRSGETVYLVETKAQQQTIHPNVQRKLKAAVAWCNRINSLEGELRGNCVWHYVLLGEAQFYEWRDQASRMSELLNFARIRPQASVSAQSQLTL